MAQAQLSLSCVLLSRQLYVFSELQATHWGGAVVGSCGLSSIVEYTDQAGVVVL